MTDFPFNGIYSHPPAKGGDSLTTHLQTVSTLAGVHAQTGELAPDGTEITLLTRTCGVCHDIGKATTWFQQHLDDQTVPQNLYQHSPLGALATYRCLRAQGATHEDAFVGLIAVAKHHGALPDVAHYIHRHVIRDEGRTTSLKRQIKNIHTRPEAREVVDKALQQASDGAVSWASFSTYIYEGDIYEDLKVEASKGSAPNDSACSSTFYEAVIGVWAALTKADKTDAANLPTDETPLTIRQGAVKDYIDTFPTPDADRKRRLNEYRSDAHDAITNAVLQLPAHGGLATITLPTGLGKTLSGLDAAVEFLADRDSESGRIIYALPYTSIVDQTAEEVLDVFNVDRDDEDAIDPYGWALTIDHHLESTATRIRDGEDETADEEDDDEFADEELLLGKMWESGVVVTTYVQLFESLVGPSNAQSLKLTNLRDSVIILDEPQTLPLDWWPLARRITYALMETFDVTVLSMSATQPYLFRNDDWAQDDFRFDPVELVDDPSRYFRAFHRTNYHLHESVVSYLSTTPTNAEPDLLSPADGAGTLVSTVCESDTSALAICNTIESARSLSMAVHDCIEDRGRGVVDIGEVYDECLHSTDEDDDSVNVERVLEAVTNARAIDDVVTLHMTTRHRPTDRRVILGAAEELATANIPFVFVATQLVEAGVDVSFHRVYRDFAPMTSLVQAAGRCNRSFEWGEGNGYVTIWRLGPSSGEHEPPSKLIYARNAGDEYNFLAPTRTALQHLTDDGVRSHIPDTEIADEGVDLYYDALVDRRPGNYAFVRYLNSGRFQTLRREAEYIDDRDTVEVVVCRISEDDNLVSEYEDQKAAGKHNELRRTRAKLSERAVSIPREKFDLGTLNPRILSASDDGRTQLVSVSATDEWFSSQFGANSPPATTFSQD